MSLASQAARRYADAFIGSAGDELTRAVEELSAFAETVQSVPELRHVLLNPAFSADEEKQVLHAVMEQLSLSDTVRRFITLLAARERMGEIADIAETVKRLSDERANRVRATVEAAEELTPDALERLKAALEKRTGRKVDLDVSIDPTLIGGIRTRVGSLVFDGTIRTELDRLRETLSAADQIAP